MPIKPYVHTAAEMSEQEVDDAVISIISSLGKDFKAFQHASNMYNSDFFKAESNLFKQQLCKALKFHFAEYQNNFWNKAALES